jgi:hypothetical protein
MRLSFGLILVPIIPGVRSLPRWIPIYKIIWRDYYRDHLTTNTVAETPANQNTNNTLARAGGRLDRDAEVVDCHLGHASQSTIVRIGPAKRGRAEPEAHRSSTTGCSSFRVSSGSASR